MAAIAAETRNPIEQPGFGPALRRLRESRGLSKANVARRCNVDPSHVTRLEQSERGVSRDLVDKLARALDASHGEELELMREAGFLSPETAQVLLQPELARLSALLAGEDLAPAHRDLIVRHLRLALDAAASLGYRIADPFSS
ncbi:MAG: helix-turn-helix domain-containing protein [Chloroflexota bacterium]